MWGNSVYIGGYRKVNNMTFTVLTKHEKHEGHLPGKGMVNPNLRGSLFWEEMIDDCCICCHLLSVLFWGRQRTLLSSLACIKKIWFIRLSLKFLGDLASRISTAPVPHSQMRSWVISKFSVNITTVIGHYLHAFTAKPEKRTENLPPLGV